MPNTRLVTITTKANYQPSAALPASAATGEALVNTSDGKLYYKGFISGTGSTTYVPSLLNAAFFEVGSHLSQLKLDDKIITYSGVSNLTGLFLSGTSTGFVLAPISSIVAQDSFVTGGTFSYLGQTLTLKLNNGQPNVTITGFTDVYVTGGTMNAGLGTATFTNNTGGTFQVTGFTTSGGAAGVTAVTVNNNVITVVTNGGGTTNSTINAVTAGTYNTTAGTINLIGSGTLGSIPGIQTIYVTDGTIASNRTVSLSSNTLTFSSLTQSTLLTLTGSNVGIGISPILATNPLTVSAATNPLKIIGIAQTGVDGRILSSDANGVIHFRTDVLTGITSLCAATLTNNIITTIFNGGSATATTINAATGGTLSNGTITLAGSGTLSTITGIPLATPFVSAFTYSNNVFTILNNTGGTLTALINTVTGFTVNGVLTVTGNTFITGNTLVGGNVTATNLFTSPTGLATIGTGGLIVGSGGSEGIPGTGDVIINGSLTVFGNSVSAFTTNLYAEDPNITVNYNPTGNTFATSLTAGFTVQNGLGVSGLTGDSVFYQIAQTGVPTTAFEAYQKRFWETNLYNIMVGSTGGTGTGQYVLVTLDTLNGGNY